MSKPIKNKFIKTVTVVSLVAVTLTGAAFAPGQKTPDAPPVAENTVIQSTVQTDAPKSFEKILDGLRSYTKEPIKFDANELPAGSDYDAFYDEVLTTDPNRFFVKSWMTYRNGSVAFTYHTSRSEITRLNHENEKEADRVANEIFTPEQTEREKVTAIHDYIAKNVVYDSENFKNGTESPIVYTSYGALNQGVAVCDGYARAAEQLLARAGIDSVYVVGYAGGQLHAWNLVNVDGAYYHMDITWDDPQPDTPGAVQYDYFLIGDDQMAVDHEWNQADYPAVSKSNYVVN